MRRLPFALREKVENKLNELVQQGIIEEVSGTPTEWVSPLVVVPKASSDIRLCVDMRSANQAIIRERHYVPTVEEVLTDLSGSTVFSKCDLRMGFHQIKLDEKLRDITTFVSHVGLFWYRRLLFGTTSSPEKYEKLCEISCRDVQESQISLMI